MSRLISPVVVLLATSGLVGPATAADWTVAPAANRFGAGRERLSYTINPGAEVQDGIAVANTGAAPLQVSLRAAGGLSWLKFNQDDVTVEPGQSVEVPFAITLPADARPGDHLGGIVTRAHGEDVGLPVRLRVGGALRPSLAVEDVHVDGATVTYTIHNTGNAILSARPRVSLSGPFGRFAKRSGTLTTSPAIFPGQTWNGSTSLDGVPAAVRLTATVTVLPLLTDAAGSTAPLAVVKASGHGWRIPWALVVLGALGVAGIKLRPRRRRAAV
jgi:hypothetical protein